MADARIIAQSSSSPWISCEELKACLHQNDQLIFDATFFLPRQQRNAEAEFQQQHIPGALFFDIDRIADPDHHLPHTLPTADQFARQVGQLGVDKHTSVIVYDNNHLFAAARAWWMFRVFGHEQVKILKGGLGQWLKQGYPTDSASSVITSRRFTAKFQAELFVDLPQMQSAFQDPLQQIVDARSSDSFKGQRPLKESDLKPGHIPGSINIPYRSLFAEDGIHLLSKSQLKSIFLAADVDLAKPIIASCGSGVSAAVLQLALYLVGVTSTPMYDGSWAEWGRQGDECPKQVFDEKR